MIKVVTVVGARPQFIKAAIVSRAFAREGAVREVLLHTGQHYDERLSEVFYRELEIPRPAFELAIGSGSHGVQTGRMLAGIEEILVSERPDWVLVYGDTNSTLAGALAAAKLPFALAHVEAGLRSFNRRMPEEINRIVTDHCADLLFAPTDRARSNLLSEGIPDERINLVGDVMYDAAIHFGERAEKDSRLLERHDLEPGGFILATIHRAENTDDPRRLEAIFHGLEQVGREKKVILPLHPRTRKALDRLPTGARFIDPQPGSAQSLRCIEPLGYLDMLKLERAAALVVTDSGGVQKEAFFQRTPCVTLRTETEWKELVEIGWNRVVAPESAEQVRDAVLAALQAGVPSVPPAAENLYGGGQAARRIVDTLRGGPAR